MRSVFIYGCVACLTSLALAQKPVTPSKTGGNQQASVTTAESGPKDMFESKVKAEWEAIKNKDKKAYGALLADDYEGVEVDNQGERNKLQAVTEMAESNVANYTLWGYKSIPLGSDAAFIIYEVTMQFPPRSVIRFSRVYITELWVKRAGEWKELHYQETHIK